MELAGVHGRSSIRNGGVRRRGCNHCIAGALSPNHRVIPIHRPAGNKPHPLTERLQPRPISAIFLVFF
jgi:hypothetical protein